MDNPPRARGGIPALVTTGILALTCIGPFLVGRDPAPPSAAPSVPAELEGLLAQWTEEAFPGNPDTLADHLDSATARHLTLGRRVYEDYCGGCHGENADGLGESASFLVPRPRNFRHGLTEDAPPLFKFRSTESGNPPLIEDMVKTIRFGLKGSAMPEHRLLDPVDVEAVAEYVLWVSKTSEFAVSVEMAYFDEEPDLSDEDELADFHEEYVLAEAERIQDRYGSPARLSMGIEPANDSASVTLGEKLYVDKGCHECHGRTGRGDGTSSDTLSDDWGFPIDPRDLTSGVFRAGSKGRDLFLRIRGGVTGTPMPSFDDLSDDEVWHLVHFVQSLAGEASR